MYSNLKDLSSDGREAGVPTQLSSPQAGAVDHGIELPRQVRQGLNAPLQ